MAFTQPKKAETTAVVRHEPQAEQLAVVRKIVEDCGLATTAVGGDRLAMTFKVASGMKALSAAITDDMMQDIMDLQGSPLGYMTDRQNATQGPTSYRVEEVRPVVIEAMLRGFYPINNEFNIIKGRFYATKNGYHRLLSEFPGLTNLHVVPGTPKQHGDDKMIVPTKATWRFRGEPMSLGMDNEVVGIVVKINRGMGEDAALGKAMRKTLARIYERITGSAQDYGEDGAVEGEVVVEEPAPTPEKVAAVFLDEAVPVIDVPAEEVAADATASQDAPGREEAPKVAFAWPPDADTVPKRVAALKDAFGPVAKKAFETASANAPLPWSKQNPSEQMTTLEEARRILTGEGR